jgi:DNA primase
MGRYNSLDVSEDMAKWLPIIPFPKSYTLFGFSENYADIVEKNCVIVSESEKAPMQFESKGINNALGLGGSHISPYQSNVIKSLNVPNVILAYDEGIEEDFIVEQAKSLILNTPFITNKVGYIYDSYNDVLSRGSKQSPSDLSIGDINLLLKDYVKWVN